MDTAPARRGRGLLSLPLAILLLLVGQLVIANEIRYQGCVARADRQVAIALQFHTAGGTLECHRVPFR